MAECQLLAQSGHPNQKHLIEFSERPPRGGLSFCTANVDHFRLEGIVKSTTVEGAKPGRKRLRAATGGDFAFFWRDLLVSSPHAPGRRGDRVNAAHYWHKADVSAQLTSAMSAIGNKADNLLLRKINSPRQQPQESTTDCNKQKNSQDTAAEQQIYAFLPS
jgi:hypothetical protein